MPVSTDANAHVYTAFSFVREGDADIDEFEGTGPLLGARRFSMKEHTYAPNLAGSALVFWPLAVAASSGVLPFSAA